MSSSELDKYEKLRQKHGAELHKAQANKQKIKQGGTVKSWMEVFVLLNEQDPKFQQPVKLPPLDARVKKPEPPKQVVTPTSKPVAPVVVVAAKKPVDSPQFSIKDSSSPAPPKTGLKAYDQLPTPQNPKQVMANDRKAYDQALEDQIKVEQIKLEALIAKKVNPDQIQKQRDIVDQLTQQKDLVERQKQQAQQARTAQIKEAQNRAAQRAAEEKAKYVPPTEPLEGAQLEESLKQFFAENEPEALKDGRLMAVLVWTEERGVERLNAMLREQYGRDLNGKLNIENTAVDQVQADRYARRLMGFYKAHGNNNMAWPECLKVGEWACKVGEAALNERLREKYNEDLDSYGQSVMLQIEPRLRAFYQKWNPDIIEKGLGPLLTWVVSNGVDALNEMLTEKYGENLDGKKGEIEEKSEFRPPQKSARQVLHRELQKVDSVKSLDERDLVEKRKDTLIKQLASFLEVKDPHRLKNGGLLPLVQWAIPRSDRQVDDLLMESYATDLKDAGLRRLSFDENEVQSWRDMGSDEGPATGAARAVSNAMEDEFARAEIRSMRATTDERPLSSLNGTNIVISPEDHAEYFPEPDF